MASVEKNPSFNFPEQKDIGQEKPKIEKETDWENKLQEIEKTADTLGLKIDKGVKETVAAFQINGLPTSDSCEGHLERSSHAPWVEIESPNEPEERWVGQNEIFYKVADKHDIPYEEIRNGIPEEHWESEKHDEAFQEAANECLQKGETEGYKKWLAKNRELRRKVEKLLEEFYQNRDAEPDVHLIIDTYAGDRQFRVRNGGKDYEKSEEELTEEQKSMLVKNLPQYQKEMRDFTEFIKNKYFQEEK